MAVIPSADAVLSADAAGVTRWLEMYFRSMNAPAPVLSEAMSYAALNGGKRVRASLVLSAARLAGDARLAEPVAAALEMVHAYSLIHDDLPAMDDADTRRGMPATHIAFDEAIAILAGDALQTEAFSVLSTKLGDLPADRILALIRILADASGVHGMAGGQMLDIQAETMVSDMNRTRAMQELKTGALIRSAAVMGVIVGGGDEAMQNNIGDYADRLGFAFQIADDILDYRSTGEVLGKPVGRDAEQGKASFVALLGLEQAEQKAAELIEEAIALLAPYASRADELRALAAFSIHRKS
jgi:geranylgeranyl pyrophosphate synthase